MSKSLVRASLELFGYEDDLKRDKKKKKKSKAKGILDLIPINHRTIGKTTKKEAIVLKRARKLTVDEARKRLDNAVDPTEENVRTLLLLNGGEIDSETVEKLVTRAQKRTYVPKESTKPPEPETTAFTEEDFKKFEEEYCEL